MKVFAGLLLAVLLLLGVGAAGAEGLVELPEVKDFSFEHGYDIIELADDGGRVVKTVPGPTTANVSAYLDSEGERFFLSDWSHERLRKRESFYWIRPRKTAAPPPASPAPKELTDLEVYPEAREIRFEKGFRVLDNPAVDSKVVQKIAEPASASIRAHLDARGTRFYLSEWSWEQRQQGRTFNWIMEVPAQPLVAVPVQPVAKPAPDSMPPPASPPAPAPDTPLTTPPKPALESSTMPEAAGISARAENKVSDSGAAPPPPAIPGKSKKRHESDVPAATPAELAPVLGNGEVLVNFFRSSGFRNEKRVDFYEAIVLVRGQEPRQVRIGDRGDIERFVGGLRSFLRENGQNSSMDRAERDAVAKQLLQEGYDLVMKPLEREIRIYRRLTICGEGQLLFLPFELLRKVEAGWGKDALVRTVGELWEVRYLNSTRDLLREWADESGEGQKKAFLVGNPDFGLEIPADLAWEIEGERSEFEQAVTRNSNAAGEVRLVPLPGGKEKIEKLESGLLEKEVAATSLTGAEATEQNVIGEVQSPDFLHLGTYGIFLGGAAGFSSGVALAGAQTTLERWQAGEVPAPSGDGILLAGELSGLNLSGTELVVLSSCEMAGEELISGEGLMKLREALIEAGARNIVLPLWPAEEGEPAELMERFYKQFLKGKPVPTALADARRQVFREIEREDGFFEAARRAGSFVATSIEPYPLSAGSETVSRD